MGGFKYDWRDLHVGESFFVPAATPEELERIFSNLKIRAHKNTAHAKSPLRGHTFRVEKEENGVRVTLTAVSQEGRKIQLAYWAKKKKRLAESSQVREDDGVGSPTKPRRRPKHSPRQPLFPSMADESNGQKVSPRSGKQKKQSQVARVLRYPWESVPERGALVVDFSHMSLEDRLQKATNAVISAKRFSQKTKIQFNIEDFGDMLLFVRVS